MKLYNETCPEAGPHLYLPGMTHVQCKFPSQSQFTSAD